jgi:peroxiredoxin (alkyl hydroperoxide reductase subunit C)
MTDEPIQSIRALRLGDEAPAFRARSTQGPVALDDFRGHWLLLFSHPADFTPVCTSEFIALARATDAFARLDCRLLALSIDSLYAHLAWAKAIESEFKVKIPFPIVEDPSMAVAKAYGMLDEGAADTATVRASFFIDPTGIIRAMTWYPMNVGRSVDELLRLLAALRRAEAGDVLLPEGWRPGGDVLLPPVQNQAEATGRSWFYRSKKDNDDAAI